MSNLADRIDQRLKSGCDIFDTAELLVSAVKLLRSYSYVTERKIIEDEETMCALKTWAPEHHENIISDR